MRAIVIEKESLVLRDRPVPEPGSGEVRVRIRATAVNRADVLQRRGRYPVPAGSPPDIPGLELAGEVEALGPNVTELAVGDRVYGIAGGGTYAEQVVVHARTLAKMPAGFDFIHAAAIPEVFITAYDAMVVQGRLSAGETVLVHACGSGVGTAAVQIAKAIGAKSIGTARTAEKIEKCKALGLDHGVTVLDGLDVDLVLDLVGGDYTSRSLKALRSKGRLLLVGLVGGARTEMDLGLLLRKRITLIGTVLRARPLEEKIEATHLLTKLGPLFESGALKPVIDRVLPLEEASKAHDAMERNEGFGKIVLTL